MSEQPTARATRPPATPAKAPGRKYAGLTRNQWFIVGGVFAAALGYILWRRHEAAKTAGTATSTSTSTSTAATLAALEEELQALENQGYSGDAASGGGTSGGSGTGAAGVSTAAGTVTTAPSTSTATTTAPAPAAGGGPITVIPIGLHTTAVNTTSVQVAWTAPTVPAGQGPLTGYTCEVYEASGASEGSSWTVPKTQLYANAGGLKSKTSYHLNCWCEPAKTGGPHASVSFTTK
jgi:hypothetical protein